MNHKYRSALFGLTLFFVGIGVSYASGDHVHEQNKKEHAQEKDSAHDMEGKKSTLTGNIIGLTCFVKHGAIGDKHKTCAKQCAEKGLPIGLKTESGQIYIISGEGHASAKEIASPLMKYLEDKVTIVGKTFEKNGTKMLIVEKIKKG